ncbi:hypothetical protein E5288_WYG000078 [Bos mutus]|uniref:Uncharacterized protein n=1 Tax=Bos mutus TaxID=72004 RepID=A0A6B0RFK8_9CETA|nr:hypothetical protein [Bos mutus]
MLEPKNWVGKRDATRAEASPERQVTPAGTAGQDAGEAVGSTLPRSSCCLTLCSLEATRVSTGSDQTVLGVTSEGPGTQSSRVRSTHIGPEPRPASCPQHRHAENPQKSPPTQVHTQNTGPCSAQLFREPFRGKKKRLKMQTWVLGFSDLTTGPRRAPGQRTHHPKDAQRPQDQQQEGPSSHGGRGNSRVTGSVNTLGSLTGAGEETEARSQQREEPGPSPRLSPEGRAYPSDAKAVSPKAPPEP